MPKESFLLVSLKEDKAKKLAQVVTNDSCRKILEHLSEKESTESELAKKLNIPISTVHYNLQQLLEAGLVIADEYHYSEKGKEVNHYKLANKYIIIAPKSTWGIKEKLKGILPAAFLIAAAAATIHLFSEYFIKKSAGSAAPVLAQKAMAETAAASADRLGGAAQDTAQAIISSQPSIWPNASLWFIIGAAVAISLYFLIDYIRYKRK